MMIWFFLAFIGGNWLQIGEYADKTTCEQTQHAFVKQYAATGEDIRVTPCTRRWVEP